MRSWSGPAVPALPLTGPPVALHDTATNALATPAPQTGPARLYVCGITPYDATHLGHAATYVGFDLLNRAWRSAGHEVRFVQNVTDVDDPLLERATKVGVNWRDLAERETELFRQDMIALRVLPPDSYVGAVESVPLVIAMVERLRGAGAVYAVDGDLYHAVAADPGFGEESGLDRATMLELFGERGGDPERPGKKDPLDALVWRAERRGEPAWPSPFGAGRPGWHVECAAIATEYLGAAIEVQGGGSDLVFPHHEMCAVHAQAAHPGEPFAQTYVHAGMVGFDGEKMSKSRGNLVFVSALRNSEVDSMAIRLTLLRHHYRSDWEWTDAELFESVDTLEQWRRALSIPTAVPARPVIEEVLAALAADLDAPAAVAAVQRWVDATLVAAPDAGGTDEQETLVRMVLDAVLGLAL